VKADATEIVGTDALPFEFVRLREILKARLVDGLRVHDLRFRDLNHLICPVLRGGGGRQLGIAYAVVVGFSLCSRCTGPAA